MSAVGVVGIVIFLGLITLAGFGVIITAIRDGAWAPAAFLLALWFSIALMAWGLDS